MSNYSDNAGGDAGSGGYHNSILKFAPDTKSWTQVGELQSARHYPGACVVRSMWMMLLIIVNNSTIF